MHNTDITNTDINESDKWFSQLKSPLMVSVYQTSFINLINMINKMLF